MEKVCRHFVVQGKVQDVWYRAFTQKTAQELNINGWVKNLSNGQVEVLACGNKDQLKILEKRLWEGPKLANVTDILISDKIFVPHVDFTIAEND